MADKQDHEIFNIEDNPVPEGAKWHSTGDEEFFKASRDAGDEVKYIIVDGVYHLGTEVDIDYDAGDE